MLRETFREIKRRRPPDIIRQMAIHFALKFRIGLSRRVGLLQIEDQRHQRLGDKAAAIDAEMHALGGAGAARVGRRRGRGLTLHPRRPRPPRAARMKARILSGSFSPGTRSTPEDTSTPGAGALRKASATWPVSRPAERMNARPQC